MQKINIYIAPKPSEFKLFKQTIWAWLSSYYVYLFSVNYSPCTMKVKNLSDSLFLDYFTGVLMIYSIFVDM